MLFMVMVVVQYVMILLNGGVPIGHCICWYVKNQLHMENWYPLVDLAQMLTESWVQPNADILETKLSVDSSRFYIKLYDVQVS